MSVHAFIFDKYMRLVPVMFAGLLLSFAYSPQTLLMYLSLLNSMGMGLEDSGPNWYISVFFYGIIFYYALYSFISKEKAFFITCILTCLGFSVALTTGQGKLHSYTLPNGLNIGLLRTVAGIGAGIILARLLEYLQPLLNNIFTNTLFRSICFTVAETVALGMLFNRLLRGEKFPSQIIIVLLFSIVLSSFSLKYGLLGRLLDHPFSSVLGKYSYSIYAMQQIVLSLFCRVLWPRYPALAHNVPLCISSVLILGLLAGIIGYHLIEMPALRWYKKINS